MKTDTISTIYVDGIEDVDTRDMDQCKDTNLLLYKFVSAINY